VDAIAHRTAAENPADFAERFSERIRVLSANQDLLFRNEWMGVAVEDLAHAQLPHFADLIGSRIVMRGPKPSHAVRTQAAISTRSVRKPSGSRSMNLLRTPANTRRFRRIEVVWKLAGISANNAFTMSLTEREGSSVLAAS
jgi:HWE histidine kinase